MKVVALVMVYLLKLNDLGLQGKISKAYVFFSSISFLAQPSLVFSILLQLWPNHSTLNHQICCFMVFSLHATMQVLCRLSPYNVWKAPFQVLLCKALVCIAELMAFRMSKGNVAHRKRKLLALRGFSSKIGSCALGQLPSILLETFFVAC